MNNHLENKPSQSNDIPDAISNKWRSRISSIRRLCYEAGLSLSSCDDYSVQYIKHLNCTEDADRKTLLGRTDFKPKTIELDTGGPALLDLVAPANRALNSLPRWSGHIVIPVNRGDISKLLQELNSEKSEFNLEVQKWLKQNSTESNVAQYNLIKTLKRCEVIENENFELLIRKFCLTSAESSIARLHSRWRCNHYSQPIKTTAGTLLRQLTRIESPSNEVSQGINVLKTLPKNAVIVKRFYSPPTVATRWRYDKEISWSRYTYNSLPIIIQAKEEHASLKTVLPDLDAYLTESNEIRISNPQKRQTAQPLKLLFQNWYLKEC